MNVLYYLLYIVESYFGFYLLFPVLILIIYIFVKKGKLKSDSIKDEVDIAAVVTAYKETDVLIPLTDSLIKQNYKNYLIYIVADECDISALNFSNDKVIILKPDNKIGSKVKSLFYAIENFNRKHNAIAIFDSDNLAHPDFLKHINYYFHKGFKAVQGERKSKNYDTMFACLDSARDFYYNFYDGLASFRIGSSATLAGSGMGFDVDLLKESLVGKNIVGGFDKILQSEIVKKGLRIAYSRDAIVYDEKVRKSDQLVKQRTRWINTWFKYFKFGFLIMFRGIISFRWSQILYGFILLRPPIFLFILGSLFFTALSLLINIKIFFIWVGLFVLFFISFVIALLIQKVNKNIWKSLFGIPVFIFYQISSLLQVKKANKKFLETEHTVLLTIDDILKMETENSKK